ncbi:MAG: helix-turn-helix transcriptional regulator [Caulobacter sp.]
MIRQLRKAKGRTQEQLAHESGVVMRYVAGVALGEENPSLKFLMKIANALGLRQPCCSLDAKALRGLAFLR